MEQISLGVPRGVVESLPEDGASAEQDMRRAVQGIEDSINDVIESADDESDAAARILDGIEDMEARAERYDDFVPELRAWGQSPIYAIAWRNLYLEVLAQLSAVDWLSERLDRERTYRQVEDGIRFGKD